MQRGALDEAARYVGEALADAEDDADLLNMAAMIAYRRRRYGDACALIERAVQVRGSDARLWFNYGLANAAANCTAEARTAFERVLALSPGHDGAAQWLAKLPRVA
jgi:Flp pilus assembly protein TadD